MRTDNPLAAPRDHESLKGYYLAALSFWLEAMALQRSRCEGRHDGPRDSMADIIFYVVCVQHIREVALQASRRLSLVTATTALEVFDARWPTFRNLRDVLEHLLPVKPVDEVSGHFGVTFFPGSIENLLPGGNVEFLVEIRDTTDSARTLARELENALGTV